MKAYRFTSLVVPGQGVGAKKGLVVRLEAEAHQINRWLPRDQTNG